MTMAQRMNEWREATREERSAKAVWQKAEARRLLAITAIGKALDYDMLLTADTLNALEGKRRPPHV